MSDISNYDTNKNLGWICDYRSLMNWQWYKCPLTTHLFLHCIRKANRQDGYFQGVKVYKGSFITSYETLAYETGLTVKQVRTALDKHLLVTGELTKETTNKYTIITVVNYEQYQVKQSNVLSRQKGKQRAFKGQAKGQTKGIQRATNNNINNITSEGVCPTGTQPSQKQTSLDIDPPLRAVESAPQTREQKEQREKMPPLNTSEWLMYCEQSGMNDDDIWSEWAQLDNGKALSVEKIKEIREMLSSGK